MTADADAPNSRQGHALDAYIDASVQQLLSTPPNGDNRQDTLVYLGNWHVALARILLQDPVLRPEDKIVIMNIMVSASPGAAAAFPSYKLLGEKANIRGRATIADAITVARVTRWITLCRRVRDAKGRWRGNLYALHDEPLALADTLRLDVEYLPFLNQSCNHRRQHVRRIAQGVLSTIQGDIATGHDVTAPENPLERRMAAIRALQQDTAKSVDHYYSLSSAALAAVKSNHRVQLLHRDDRVQELNTVNSTQVQDLNLENNALSDNENNKLNGPCRNLNTATTCSSSCINITTTNTAEANVEHGKVLVFPEALRPNERLLIDLYLVKVASELRQPVLDEFAGRLRASKAKGTPITNPLGYLISLCNRANTGGFNITSAGTRIGDERRTHERTRSAVAESIIQNPPATPQRPAKHIEQLRAALKDRT